MKKYEEVKQSLILNGYDDAKVDELSILFVEDFLDSEYEETWALDKYTSCS